MKPRISISFSGGRTSAVMTKLIYDTMSATHDLVTVFANTGREDPRTLDFVHKCDQHFGWNVAWVEADVSPIHGVGITSRIVDYETASRDGRPFRDYIAKYGIPNMGSPKCTGALKELPIKHFIRSAGWLAGTFDSAIGIRADEAHRMSVRAHEERFIYPLVELGWTKEKVIREVLSWPFDLGLREHEGNCQTCWKKSFRKLATIALEAPERFDFERQMESEFSNFKVTDATRSPCGRRLFFSRPQNCG